MRLATYNVEWFAGLFDQDGEMQDDSSWSSRWDVTKAQQLAAVGAVFQAIDADAIMIIEAPDGHAKRSSGTALEGFAKRFGLRANKALLGYVNDTSQEIALLYNFKVLEAEHDPKGIEAGKKGNLDAPRFDSKFRVDLHGDNSTEVVGFSKPPLEVALKTKAGKALRLIGVHAKSKAPHGAKNDEEVMQISIANRRKQLAQCIWIRQRVDAHLTNGDSVVVLGDFNDGPGLDKYEAQFGRSGVEIVLGEGEAVRLTEPHAHMVLNRTFGAAPTTSRFFLKRQNFYLGALLDYIMVSPDLAAKAPEWRIWHPFENPDCWGNDKLRRALLTASDHFPVTLDIDL